MVQPSPQRNVWFPWIAILCVATCLTCIGLAGSYLVSHGSSEGSTADKIDLWFLSPGYFFVILMGFLGFVRGGVHSAGEYFWLVGPISWVVYFLLGVAVSRFLGWRRARAGH